MTGLTWSRSTVVTTLVHILTCISYYLLYGESNGFFCSSVSIHTLYFAGVGAPIGWPATAPMGETLRETTTVPATRGTTTGLITRHDGITPKLSPLLVQLCFPPERESD